MKDQRNTIINLAPSFSVFAGLCCGLYVLKYRGKEISFHPLQDEKQSVKKIYKKFAYIIKKLFTKKYYVYCISVWWLLLCICISRVIPPEQ